MLKKFFRNWFGLTLLEMCIVVGMFGLFLIVFYTTLKVGLKTWKIGEVRADLSTTAEVVMKRMKSDIENASFEVIETNYITDSTPYICFETPIYNGQFQMDNGKPIWQGHILYYALKDPEDKNYDTKVLYKRYVPHNTEDPYLSENTLVATFLYDLPSYIDDTELTLYEQEQGQTLRKICDRLSFISFEELYGTVSLELEFKENFRNSKTSKVMFETGSQNIGTETLSVKYTITARN